MFKIKIKEVSFHSSGENTIFESAKENSILIEHSCLSGRCSSCKAKVIAGSTRAVDAEIGLTEAEKAEGYILTCIHKPESDVELDVEIIENFKFIKTKVLPVKISSITKITIDTIKLELRFPPSADFEFIPGQYLNLIKGNIRRSYSIAGCKENKVLQFYIKNYKDGQMSKYLFEEAKENDLLRIEGPYGSFFLRESSKQYIIFLATGTGIAPILSILKDNNNYKLLGNRNVYLFQGGRFKEDLIEQDFFRQSDIIYYPVLSRAKEVGFQHGYVQNILLEQKIDLRNATIYACGSEKMISGAKSLLIGAGLNPKEFYSDIFLKSI